MDAVNSLLCPTFSPQKIYDNRPETKTETIRRLGLTLASFTVNTALASYQIFHVNSVYKALLSNLPVGSVMRVAAPILVFGIFVLSGLTVMQVAFKAFDWYRLYSDKNEMGLSLPGKFSLKAPFISAAMSIVALTCFNTFSFYATAVITLMLANNAIWHRIAQSHQNGQMKIELLWKESLPRILKLL